MIYKFSSWFFFCFSPLQVFSFPVGNGFEQPELPAVSPENPADQKCEGSGETKNIKTPDIQLYNLCSGNLQPLLKVKYLL